MFGDLDVDLSCMHYMLVSPVMLVSTFPGFVYVIRCFSVFIAVLYEDTDMLFCFFPPNLWSAKLIDTYRTKHNITASSGVTDPTVVATGISDLIYESTQPAPAASNSSGLDDDLVNAWAANLGDDGLLGNNAPAMSRVSCHLYLSIHSYMITL